MNNAECLYCDKGFNKRHKNHKFCSRECKDKYKYENMELIELKCDNCGEKIKRKNFKRYNHTFCSKECELEFKHKEHWEFRKCEICGENFECKKLSTQRFCSIKCQSKWQSEYLVGENAVGYKHDVSIEDRTLSCEWCGENFQVTPSKINSSRFCSKDCRREWYSKFLTQTDEWKEKSAIRAAKMLEDDVFNQRVTGIQIAINNLLNKINVKYKNEKAFGKVTIDNYLLDGGLMIENMGTFYHCDNRKYPLITYKRQVNRIRLDKIKHSYIKNKYNIEILYLWEEDIINNLLLCEKLIELYISNNGKLKNYHSFNYILDKNNNIKLNDQIIKPYMSWDIENLHEIIDISTKEKISKKQQDKWITFNCENCGEEREELISHYNKHDHHYCSRECARIGRKGQKKK